MLIQSMTYVLTYVHTVSQHVEQRRFSAFGILQVIVVLTNSKVIRNHAYLITSLIQNLHMDLESPSSTCAAPLIPGTAAATAHKSIAQTSNTHRLQFQARRLPKPHAHWRPRWHLTEVRNRTGGAMRQESGGGGGSGEYSGIRCSHVTSHHVTARDRH